MDDDSPTPCGVNTEIFNSVDRVIITKLSTGYRIEFDPNQQSRDLPNAKYFYWRFHPTVEIRNLGFRHGGRSREPSLKLRFNRSYDVVIAYGKDCTLGVGYPAVEYPADDE